MSSIVIFVWPNIGSQIASMKLAADLKDRGHSIIYMGLEDSKAYIESHGFDFVPVFTRYFPEGFLREQKKIAVQEYGIRYFEMIKKSALQFKAFFESLLGGDAAEELLGILRLKNVELMIYASGSPGIEWIAILASSIGIKGVYHHDMIVPNEDLGNPPKISTYIPSATLRSSIRIYLLWRYYHFLHFGVKFIESAYLALNGIYLRNFSKKLSRFYKCRMTKSRSRRRGDRLFILPELVSFPVSFEFPGAVKPGSYYIGTSIYLKRNEPEFPWAALNDQLPLIYCSVGAVFSYNKKKMQRYLDVLINTARFLEDRQWVFAVGPEVETDSLGKIPNNVLLVRHAPQLQLLRRATVAVTHGGANTVKECMFFGVPMVVVTGFESSYELSEIPCYASRVTFHGLGIQIDLKKFNVEKVTEAIETLQQDSFIQGQVRLMKRSCRADEERNLGVEIIEAFLG